MGKLDADEGEEGILAVINAVRNYRSYEYLELNAINMFSWEKAIDQEAYTL